MAVVELYLLPAVVELVMLKQVGSVLHLGLRYAGRGTIEAAQASRSLHGLPERTGFFCRLLYRVIWSDHSILYLNDRGTGLHGCGQVGKIICFNISVIEKYIYSLFYFFIFY